MTLRIAIITISDRSARGERPDSSGPLLKETINAQGWQATHREILPDDVVFLRDHLLALAESDKFDVILTTGGTGFGPRDITPEATQSVIERNAPGLAEAMRAASLKVTPHGDMTVLATDQYDMTIRWGHGPESFQMMSIAVEPSTQDLFVFVGRPDKIYRITQEGVIVELPTEFEKDVFNCDLTFDADGNLFALVCYSENYNVGPLLRRLYRVTSSGELSLVANLDADLPNNEDDFAFTSSGNIIMLTRGVVCYPDEYELVKITPTGEKSRIAWHLPIDPLGMAMNAEGDIFFTCAMGIFKVSRR